MVGRDQKSVGKHYTLNLFEFCNQTKFQSMICMISYLRKIPWRTHTCNIWKNLQAYYAPPVYHLINVNDNVVPIHKHTHLINVNDNVVPIHKHSIKQLYGKKSYILHHFHIQ